MSISNQELQTIAFTLANEESQLLHFKSGFVDGEHQLIMVFAECEEVVNTGWGCQMDNVKKLNDLMGVVPNNDTDIDPDKCPACDCTNIVGGFVAIEGRTAKQDCYCDECEHEWQNSYELGSQS